MSWHSCQIQLAEINVYFVCEIRVDFIELVSLRANKPHCETKTMDVSKTLLNRPAKLNSLA